MTGPTTAPMTNPTTEPPQTGHTTGLMTGPTTAPMTDPTTEPPQTGHTTGLMTGPTTAPMTDPTTEPPQTGHTTGLMTGPTTAPMTDPTTEPPQTGHTTGLMTGPTTAPMTDPTTEPPQTGLSTGPTTGMTTDSREGSSTDTTTEPKTEPKTEPQTEPKTEPKTEPQTEPKTEPKTESQTEPKTEQPRVGPVPEPTLPDLDEDSAKTYQFEFAVDEDTTKGCRSDNLSSPACDAFTYNVTQELETVYGESPAFLSVEVVLRDGSVIVSHIVTYSYNHMTDEQKMASAQDIYDDTLGFALADENLGNYTVQEDCGSCAPPAETTDILSEAVIECESEYSKATYKPYYWVCESICVSESDYCNSHGICWQRDDIDTQPICSCDWENGVWYWGYRCQYYMNQTYLIIGCSCGAAVLLVLLVCLIACCVVKSKAVPDKESQPSDDVINAFQNFGYDHTAETVVFPPIDDNNIDDGDILQRSRPYSYIYSKGEGNTNVGSSSFIGNQNGGAQRESRPEVNEDAAKRQSNGSADNRHSSLMKPNGSSSQQRNSDFWGNLDEPSAEHIKLEPFLDRYDDNDSYKIQRPRISAHYDYSNNPAAPNIYQSMDPAHTEYIPEADYAQR
eukprot:XP_800332.3 PREDICTED: uncharacterized protein LOC585323 [Strongylocentrotus purpuratus]